MIPEADAFKYWAFISYSHADVSWASWLHRALENYRIPHRLVGRETDHGPVPRKLFPVFRDRDDLAGSGELGPELQKALRQSRFQIVIASPNAARSRWVGEEIRYFKSLGRTSHVLALIVGGEPNAVLLGHAERECFPQALRCQVSADGQLTDIPAELIAADVRKGADSKLNAKLKLIAGVLGVGFNELRQRELQARNRRLGFIAGLAAAISAATIVLAIQAFQARNDAVRRQQQAEDLLQFMLGDLRDKLEPIGKLAILDSVGNKAMAYFATLDQKDLTDRALASRATALRQIGQVRTKQGDLAGAAAAFEQALKLNEEQVARYPADARALYNVGESQHSVGYAHYVKGEMDLARPWFLRHVATAERLLLLEPDKPEWVNTSAEAHINLGALEYGSKNLDQAQAAFEKALVQQQALVDRDPQQPDYQASLAAIHGWLWALDVERRDWLSASERAERQGDLRRRLLSLAPDNAGYQQELATANLLTLYSEFQIQPLAANAPVLRETLTLTAALMKLDSENIEYARNRGVTLNYLVDAQLASGKVRAADKAAAELLELARQTYRRAPANVSVIDDLLAVLAQSAKLAWLHHDAAAASERLREAQALPLTAEQIVASSASRWLDLALLDWWMAAKTGATAALEASAESWLERAKTAGAVKPELLLRHEALRNNRTEARRWLSLLTPGEREHPFVRQFCRETAMCSTRPG